MEAIEFVKWILEQPDWHYDPYFYKKWMKDGYRKEFKTTEELYEFWKTIK